MLAYYRLDPRSSRFTVQAFAGGMLSAFAHSPTFAVREFHGGMRFDPQTPKGAALHLTVKSDSLELMDNVKPKDRQEIQTTMRREVLETARYPEITFQSTEVSGSKVADHWYRILFRGELSLHGLSRAHEVEAELREGGEEIRLTGASTLALSAYRLKRVTALGGLIIVKDLVKIAFDLTGRKEIQDGEKEAEPSAARSSPAAQTEGGTRA
jgi:polyisoprenoid-binding protein YceI